MAEMMAWPLNLVEYGYNAEDIMRWMAGKTSGIYGQEGNYQVSHKSGMTVTVKAEGMLGGWLSNMNRYGIVFWNSTDIDLTVPIGDGVNPRIDRVIVSWHIPNQSELPQVEVRKGEPAAEPQPPALVNDGEYAEICLAEITVPAGAVEISQENITDTRLDEELCGIVSMGIEKYPTDGLDRQFQAWFKNLQYQLSGDVAGNLQKQIDEQGMKKLSHIKSGTNHELNGFNMLAGTIPAVFTATATYDYGDTITVDGTSYAIQLTNGDEADNNLFVTGASVPIIIDTEAKKVNFKAAGAPLPAEAMAIIKIYTANDTFVVPKSGKYRITAIGHGGSGGMSSNYGSDPRYAYTGGSGAGGGAGELIASFTKGESYPVTVDAGQSSFGSLITATRGGNGASAPRKGPGAGGIKGTVSGYTTLLPSEDGKSGTSVAEDANPGQAGGGCNGAPGGSGGGASTMGGENIAWPGSPSVGTTSKGLPPFGTGSGSAGSAPRFHDSHVDFTVPGWIGAIIIEMSYD